jgi:hypothetical protein
MRVNLFELNQFSKCPRSFELAKKDTAVYPVNKYLLTTLSVMKQIYTNTLEREHFVDYKQIVGWVNNGTFKDVDITNEYSYSNARSLSEHILSFISTWQRKLYFHESTGGFVDLTVELPLGKHLIRHTIPIILPLDPITICYLDTEEVTKKQMLRNLEVRGMAWLVSQFLGSDVVNVRHLQLKQKGGFGVEETILTNRGIKNTEDILLQIIESMSCGINYPAVSAQCDLCLFKRRCRI